MIHLPDRLRGLKQKSLIDSLVGSSPTKTLSREEAQAAVDAATAILDGIKVLFVLAEQGNSEARRTLRQWREVLGKLAAL